MKIVLKSVAEMRRFAFLKSFLICNFCVVSYHFSCFIEDETMQITMKQSAVPLAIYVAVIWHKIGRVLPMTLGYESYIIVIVRKYNYRKFLKVIIFSIFYTCLYYEVTKKQE